MAPSQFWEKDMDIPRWTRLNYKKKSRCDIISDTIEGKTHVITRANVDGVRKRAEELRKLHSPKQDMLFKGDHEGFVFARIAKIPRLTIIKANRGPFYCEDCREMHPCWKNPDGSDNDDAFVKWLDRHPQYKTLDAGWSKPKARSMNRGGAKELLVGSR